ncbi:hypothetical protein PSM7751_01490 [Pseudooceanicola marinus]|uniref:Uncharacterized protein n=1 Tax=Pseudooceanicola marinus TaxID=396013 RepID=A0A1X6YZ28_9RHOB|nr:hypothetical protein [Pseudooceanicola marinus]PJE32597.1 hypothetical protein CVM50_06780 [Pseudooceanicola marinus]SLN35558.1 hypothetical protein PSM7751_01490 [Pseudooceanicola marinus]
MILPENGGHAGDHAQPFHDILDGYFTLKESVRQMMARHDLSWAWMLLCHAPVMEIDGLAPDAPVPLHLRDGYAGLIDTMVLTVTRPEGEAAEVSLLGTGEWRWLDVRANTALPADIRLGEPAYFTGFGLSSRPIARPLAAAEVLADLPRLMGDAAGFRPFSA